MTISAVFDSRMKCHKVHVHVVIKTQLTRQERTVSTISSAKSATSMTVSDRQDLEGELL